jgi:hypothetical protein
MTAAVQTLVSGIHAPSCLWLQACTECVLGTALMSAGLASSVCYSLSNCVLQA